jgi:hypothetical protein
MKQRRGIGHPFVTQVDLAEFPEYRYIVQRLFARFVRQVEPVRQEYMRSIRSSPTGGRPFPAFG